MVELDVLKAQLLAEIAAAGDESAIEAVRVAALGKKGSVSELLKTLGTMTPEERQTRGAAINALKTEITEEIGTRKAALKDAAINARLKAETLDVSLPVRSSPAERGRKRRVFLTQSLADEGSPSPGGYMTGSATMSSWLASPAAGRTRPLRVTVERSTYAAEGHDGRGERSATHSAD